jgi:poly(hydroxyalkanoate) granule-associated protein
MPDVRETFKEAWSQALVGLNAAEQEAEKVISKIADAAGFTPEDVRRHAREFADRLQTQRREIEKTIDEAVKRATSRFKLPSREELDGLRQRVDAIAARVEAISKGEVEAAPPAGETPAVEEKPEERPSEEKTEGEGE